MREGRSIVVADVVYLLMYGSANHLLLFWSSRVPFFFWRSVDQSDDEVCDEDLDTQQQRKSRAKNACGV
jgi:hypothetical protein